MKRLFYILTSLLVLSSCTDELSVSNEYLDVREGDNVKVQFNINAPEEGLAETRTLGEMTDAAQKALNVWLLVFDSNGLFVQAAQATPGDNLNHDGHTDTQFTVILNATSNQRIIHFVAFDGDADSGLATKIMNTMNKFGTEAEKITQDLFATDNQAAYWQRIVVNGIIKLKKADGTVETTEDGTPKGIFKDYNDCVPLVRNFAKVSVTLDDDITNFSLTGFTIINVPNKGAIAPYKGSFVEYVNGKVQKSYDDILALGYEGTTPAETTYSTIGESDINANPHYLYETPNASGDVKGRTALIVKGAYNGGSATFYKVDLIYDGEEEDTGHMFYNILRNFEYRVTINEVTGNGHATFEEAVASAASNNLSASTTTASLMRVSDGVQKIEVTNSYFMFTEAGLQQVVKYRYQYLNGTNWVTNNNLIRLKTTGETTMYTSAPAIVASSDDAEGWRTITMTLAAPAAQAQTSNLHIYASKQLITGDNTIPAPIKKSILSGELLYRDVRVDLRNPYVLKVVPQSYVKGEAETKFRVDLLIPQNVNEGLFPMDFYIEDSEKYIYPDAANTIKLPVHVGQSIVAGKNDASFQYTRTVTKAEYASLATKTVDGVTYKVVPCYFKTSVAASDDTTVYGSNEYFNVGSGKFSNIAVAFQDETVLDIIGGKQTYSGVDYQTTELYGKKNPMTLTFYATQEAVTANTQFSIRITEGSETTTATVTATGSAANRVSFTDGNGVTYNYYRQEYAYQTKTTDGATITAAVTATMSGGDAENRNASLAMHRRYFVIAKNSFKTDIVDHLKEGNTADGSQIYVKDGYKEEYLDKGTYVGWFGRGLPQASDGYLSNDGPKADYVIDRYYQGYSTLTDGMQVTFRIYNTDIIATTSIGDLDDARNGIEIPTITFSGD